MSGLFLQADARLAMMISANLAPITLTCLMHMYHFGVS